MTRKEETTVEGFDEAVLETFTLEEPSEADAPTDPVDESGRVDPTKIPPELKRNNVLWKSEERNGKPTKVPYQLNGSLAKSTDPTTWTTFDEAFEKYQRGGFNGVGYVFSEDDELVGIDLDGCRNPETGEIAPWARRIIDKVDSYVEVSPSKTGVKIFVRGEWGAKGHKRYIDAPSVVDDKRPAIEVYNKGRYFTITGWRLDSVSPHVQVRNLTWIAENFFKDKDKAKSNGKPKATPATLNLADHELIQAAREAANGAKFSALFDGDASAYGSASEADLALASMLGFWFGQQPDRIEVVMRQSGLMREKWDKHKTYLKDTIAKVLDGQTECYGSKNNDPWNPPGDASEDKKRPKTKRKRFAMTDTGNAERAVHLYGNKLRYCWPWEKWLYYDGRRWAIDNQGAVNQLAKRTARSILKDAYKAETKEERDSLIKFARKSEGAAQRSAMLKLSRSETGIPILPEELDSNPFLFNCANGTIDLKTGKLRPHDRNDRITKLCSVAYDPSATCPTFERFMDDITAGDRDIVKYKQRFYGHCMTGDVSEQILLVLHGVGLNGKSTELGAMFDVLGDDYAMKAPADMLLTKQNTEHPTALTDLHGKRLVACIETDDGRRLAESLTKELTGGDPIRARRMREDFWQFLPTHKIVLACNHRPTVRGNDYAIWRRIKLVPYSVVIPASKRDKQLPAKLHAERAGILAWLVRGCLDWQREGLREPEAVVNATSDYANAEDVIGQFVSEVCVQGPECRVKGSDLLETYQRWSGDRRMTQRRMTTILRERGIQTRRSNGVWYEGLGLCQNDDTWA